MAHPAEAINDSTRTSEHDPLPRSTVLCVDDDPEICKVWTLRLVRHGIEVLTASNGKNAYLTAIKAAPDLILMDLHLPDEDGHQVLDRLRTAPQTRRTPVFILTGDDISATKRRMSGHLADEYLTKPIDFSALLEKLSTYLQLRTSSERRAN